MKTGAELEREWTVSDVFKAYFVAFSYMILLLMLVPSLSVEPKARSKGLCRHDHVHDGEGESRVPALEEGARAD